MEGEDIFQEVGHELGHGGIERLVDQLEEGCIRERQRIEPANQPKISGLRAELAILGEEEGRLVERLRLTAPPGDWRSRRIKALIAGGAALLFTIAGYFFSRLALAPFRLG